MLNPDGVFRGHYRYNALGDDLNRSYKYFENYRRFPELFAVIQLAKYLDSDNRLFAYFDLHAHNKFAGGFLFGCEHDKNNDNIEIRLLSKLIR